MNLLLSIIGQRRRAGFDPDALDYFSRAEALGGSFDQTAINALYTEAYCKAAISDCIAGLKTDAVWSKITELYLMSFVTFAGLMAKVKHAGTATLVNSGFAAGDYLAAGAGAGLKANGSTNHLDSNFSDLSLAPDDNSFSVYITEKAVGGTFPTYLGVRDNISPENYKLTYLNTSTGLLAMEFPVTASVNTSHENSFVTASRRGVNDFEGYKNGTSVGVDTVTAASRAMSLNYYLFAYNQNGTARSRTNARMSNACIGQGLTDTEAFNLANRINALMTAIGANVY